MHQSYDAKAAARTAFRVCGTDWIRTNDLPDLEVGMLYPIDLTRDSILDLLFHALIVFSLFKLVDLSVNFSS